MLLYNHAMQCADAMASLMPGGEKHERVSLEDYYPDLFTGLKEKEAEARRERELSEHKARMKAYAAAHNAARRKAGESNGGNDS